MSPSARRFFILTADRERWPAKGLAFGAGYAAPVAVCLAIYAAAGELARFWYFFYQYNATYAAGLAVLDRLPEFARMLADFYGWLVPLFALGLLAVRRPIASASPAWLLAIWIGTASLAILASGRVWVNYLWLSHWPLAIVAGWSLSACLPPDRRSGAAAARPAAGRRSRWSPSSWSSSSRGRPRSARSGSSTASPPSTPRATGSTSAASSRPRR